MPVPIPRWDSALPLQRNPRFRKPLPPDGITRLGCHVVGKVFGVGEQRPEELGHAFDVAYGLLTDDPVPKSFSKHA
jgi:hypothetical protein